MENLQLYFLKESLKLAEKLKKQLGYNDSDVLNEEVIFITLLYHVTLNEVDNEQ